MFPQLHLRKLCSLGINYNAFLRWTSLQSATNTEAIAANSEVKIPEYVELSSALEGEPAPVQAELVQSMRVYENFLTEGEETLILQEIEPYLKKMRYEFDHWDDAIHGYRETERIKWTEENQQILDKVHKLAFPATVRPLKFVHILDLDAKGYIKPHIDAVRFCGDTIAGLSLLTDSVMRLVHEQKKHFSLDVLLQRRSLYIMNGAARFDYTHEILRNEESLFRGRHVAKTRRVSVICRNEPDPVHTKL